MKTPAATCFSKSMLRRASRGGVPVLSRPTSNPKARIDSASSMRRWLVCPSGGTLLLSFVNQAVQKSAGRDHQRRTQDSIAAFESETFDPAVVHNDSASSRENPVNIGLVPNLLPHPLTVALLVCLRPRRPDGGASTSIQELELNSRRVDCLAHQAAERIDLANEVSLGRAADGGIARHVRNRIGRERAQANVTTQSRCRVRRLDARVASTDNHHIERHHGLLTNAEVAEDVVQRLIARTDSHDFSKIGARALKIDEHELLRGCSPQSPRTRASTSHALLSTATRAADSRASQDL